MQQHHLVGRAADVLEDGFEGTGLVDRQLRRRLVRGRLAKDVARYLAPGELDEAALLECPQRTGRALVLGREQRRRDFLLGRDAPQQLRLTPRARERLAAHRVDVEPGGGARHALAPGRRTVLLVDFALDQPVALQLRDPGAAAAAA